MKKIILSILFVFHIILVHAQIKTLIIKTRILCSRCLQCATCAPNIYNYVTEDNGVRKFALDIKANKIFVMYDSGKTSPERIRKAICDSGYDADNYKAKLAAVIKLRSCCRRKSTLSE